jgi:uncharacterized protein YciI
MMPLETPSYHTARHTLFPGVNRWVFIVALLVAGMPSLAMAEPPAADLATYFVVFLRPNPTRKPIAQTDGERLMAAHMANIHKMADDGLLAAAGPMDDTPTTISGLFLFTVRSMEEAVKVAQADPTVVAGRNTVDVHRWQGPGGVGRDYFKFKREHPETKDEMAAHVLCLLTQGPASSGAEAERDVTGLIEALHRAGAVAAGGPVDADPALAGIVIFKKQTADEARQVLGQAEAVRSGRLAVEYHNWWAAEKVLPW